MTSAHGECRTMAYLRLGLPCVRCVCCPLQYPFEATGSRVCQRIQPSVQSCRGSACAILIMHDPRALRYGYMHFKWLHPAHAPVT